MRKELLQFGAVLMLAICICGHVSEIFDRWDNTFQTGTDIEYSTVIVALIAGAVIGLAHVAAIALRNMSVMLRLLPSFPVSLSSPPSLVGFVAHSPPQTLRI